MMSFSLPVVAQTSAPQVNVRVESADSTLFNSSVLVDACTVTDTSGDVHEYAAGAGVCAMVAAADQAGISYSFQNFDFGLLLAAVNGVDNGTDENWIYWVNDKAATVGMTDYVLQEGDEFLLAYVPWTASPLRLTLEESATQAGEAIARVTAYSIDDDAFLPVDGAKVKVGEVEGVSNAAGEVTLRASAAGRYMVQAEKEGYVRSTMQDFHPEDVATDAESDEEGVVVLSSADATASESDQFSTTQRTVLWLAGIGVLLAFSIGFFRRNG